MSVIVPKPGTRGSRFPKFPGVVARFMSRMQARMFRRGGGARTQGGVPALLLETIGARSGVTRSAAVGYLEDGADAWLIIASLAGTARNPAWLHNLAGNPNATVEFGDGRRVKVQAATLAGAERDAAWQRIAVEAPEYAKYLSVTDREMPVIRLRAVEPAPTSGADTSA
jgi:deazaflavin-dependent oxidoreductase (nitroreductase family)